MHLLLPALLACGAPAEVEPTSEAAAAAPAPVPPPVAAPAAPPPPAQPPATRLDLNGTPEEAFRALPGVGPRMAHEFAEYRPYRSILQFRKEMAKYVDDDAIAGFERLVYVPIDPDTCDAPTLGQIAGLDAAAAEALIAGRPYASREAFLAALDAHLPDELQEPARALLVP